MWILVSQTDPDKRHRLLSGHEYLIGRKDCDIIIENDMSISRKHAAVQVSHPENNVVNPLKLPSLTFEDKSRLGTLVGDKRVTKSTCLLNNGAMLVFGTAGLSKYSAVYEPLITTTSCLDTAGKKASRTLVSQLGGHVISEWRKECELLVMNSLSITIKAICALIAQRPIVTPQYLEDLVKSVKNQTQTPNAENYLPPLVESQLDPKLVSFKPNPGRGSVFQGKIFIFLTAKQFKKLSVAVDLAGGTPMLLEEGTDDNEDDILVSTGSCVMSCDPFDQSQSLSKNAQTWMIHVLDLLKKHKKRPIPESEVGYAVLYCSVETHCNPDICVGVSPVVPVVGQTLSQFDLSASQLQAPASQPRDSAVKAHPQGQLKTEVSSVMTEVSSPNRPNRKRPLDTEDDDTGRTPSKRSIRTVEEASDNRGGGRQIKEEPITPVKSDDFGRGREQRRRSPSPAPVRTSPRPRIKKDRDTKETVTMDTVTMDARSSGPSSRSRSPTPVSPKTRNIKESPGRQNRRMDAESSHGIETNAVSDIRVKREVRGQHIKRRYSESEEEGLGSDGEPDLFSSVPSRRSRNPVHRAEADADSKSAKTGTGHRSAGSDDEPDLFSSLPSRKNRNNNERTQTDLQGREPSPASPGPRRGGKREPSPASPGPRRGGRREPSPASPGPRRGGKREPSPASPGPRRGGKREPSPASPSPSRGGRRQKPVKQELGMEEEQDDIHVLGTDDGPLNQDTSGPVPFMNGFLTTERPAVDQAPVDKDIVYDKNLPSDVVQVEERSLVVRQPGQRKVRGQTDQTKLQGKVKNFKKFKKTPHAGCQSLPVVIGGNDLIAHDGSQRKDLDEWFSDVIQNETQHSQSQREAQELFSFQDRGKSRAKPKPGSGRRR